MIKGTNCNGGAKSLGLAVVIILSVTGPGNLDAAEAESFPPDSPRWQLGPKATVTNYLGRRCLDLEEDAGRLKDFEMADGVIDVDMAGNGSRGFYNILFRTTQAKRDGEAVYLRPHKTGLDDAQQYTPILNGVGPWQIYNGTGFTAAVEIPRDLWFHVRLIVTGAQAQLYVSNMGVPVPRDQRSEEWHTRGWRRVLWRPYLERGNTQNAACRLGTS